MGDCNTPFELLGNPRGHLIARGRTKGEPPVVVLDPNKNFMPKKGIRDGRASSTLLKWTHQKKGPSLQIGDAQVGKFPQKWERPFRFTPGIRSRKRHRKNSTLNPRMKAREHLEEKIYT
jgi:hypothetical protein